MSYKTRIKPKISYIFVHMNKCLNTIFANEHPKCLLDGADFGVRRSITLSRVHT